MPSEPVLQRFLEITSIPGVSRDERQIIEHIKRDLIRWGVDYQEDSAAEAVGGNSGNLICRIRNGHHNEPVYLLAAHVDTVSYSSLQPQISAGRIVTADDKILGADDRVGVTILLEILEAIAHNKIEYPNLDIVFIICEEIGLRGSIHLDYSLLEARQGFNFDASAPLGHVIIAAPSKSMFDMVFLGREAHAAVAPEKGISSIKMASSAVCRINDMPLSPDIIFNIGAIQGGGHTNVVPGKTVLSGELRSFDHTAVEETLRLLQEIGQEAAYQAGGKFRMECKHLYRAFQLNDHSPLLALARSAIKEAGLPFKAIRYRAGSDANIFNQNHIEAVNLGLGYSNNHSPDEYIKIEDLLNGVVVGKNIVRQAARQARLQKGHTQTA